MCCWNVHNFFGLELGLGRSLFVLPLILSFCTPFISPAQAQYKGIPIMCEVNIATHPAVLSPCKEAWRCSGHGCASDSMCLCYIWRSESNSCPNSASSVFARRHKQAVVRDHLLETFLSTQVLPMGYRIGLSKAAKALYVSSWRIVKFLHTLERTLLWHQKELISGQALSKTSLAELNWRPCTMWWHLFVSMDLSQRQMSGQHSTFKKLTTEIVMWLWEGINDLHFIFFSPPSPDWILLFSISDLCMLAIVLFFNCSNVGWDWETCLSNHVFSYSVPITKGKVFKLKLFVDWD